MKNLVSALFLGSLGVLVACGGETKPAAAPETTSTTTAVNDANNATANGAAPAPAAPVTTPAPATDKLPEPAAKVAPKAEVTGKWCGKQVPDAASCKGKDVMYVELNAAGDAITGQICEGYNKDCMPLETSTFTGNNLALGATIKDGAKKSALKGNFTLGADDVLTGELTSAKAKAPIKKSLYRIK